MLGQPLLGGLGRLGHWGHETMRHLGGKFAREDGGYHLQEVLRPLLDHPADGVDTVGFPCRQQVLQELLAETRPRPFRSTGRVA